MRWVGDFDGDRDVMFGCDCRVVFGCDRRAVFGHDREAALKAPSAHALG